MSAEADDLPPQLKAKLQTGVRCIVELVQPQLVILFGSYAEDRAREGSDLDLLVVAETDSRIRAAVALQEALEPVLAPYAVDVLVCTPAGWEEGRWVRGFVTREADRKGLRLYEGV